MPRPATVTVLLRIVEEQSSVIRMLTQQLAQRVPEPPQFPEQEIRAVQENEVVYVQLPDRIADAIDLAPGVNAGDGMREYLEQLAVSMLAEGMDEHLVVQMIAQGEQ